jgi:hypothetical protein
MVPEVRRNFPRLRKTIVMANEHPFHLLFESLGRVPSAHAESVNRQASAQLMEALSVPVEKNGRCILLKAPRAGHGKTHLLSRIQHQLGATHEFIPLRATFGTQIDAASVTDDTLRRLLRQLPASGGMSMLDLVARRLLAAALQPLVASGEVPCQDREGAITALRVRPIETFDFHHPNAITAQWTRENFEVLGQRFSIELAQRSGLPFSGVAFWIDTLFRFASSAIENPNRVQLLAEAVRSSPGSEMERLESLLGLLSLLMRVVVVADDLEVFSTDETAALRLAAFLGTLREAVERMDVILSVNHDIWASAFLPRLSGGLADRMSEVMIELEPLTEMEMSDLLDSRVPGLGHRVLEHIDIGSSGTHARGIIRAAGMAWLKATAMDSMQAGIEVPPAPQLDAYSASKWHETLLGAEKTSPPAEPTAPPPALEAWPSPVFVPAPQEMAKPVETPPVAHAWDPFHQVTAPPVPENTLPASADIEIPYQTPVAWNEVPTSTAVPASWQEAPAPEPPLESPFIAAVEQPQPVPAPNSYFGIEAAPALTAQTPQSTETAPASDADRVDDLLRQFRERYGRVGL